jgi:hypothetical protein
VKKVAVTTEDMDALLNTGAVVRAAIDKILTVQGADLLNDALFVTALSNALAEACYRGDFPDPEGVLDAAVDCARLHFQSERAANEGPAEGTVQ